MKRLFLLLGLILSLTFVSGVWAKNSIYFLSPGGPNWGGLPADLIPSADDTYDLGEGTTPLEWKDLHVDGTANIDTLDVDVAADFGGVTVTSVGNPVLSTDAVNLHTLLENVELNLHYWFGSATLDLLLTDSEDVLLETPDADPKTLTTTTFKSSVADTPAPFLIKAGAILSIHYAADVTVVGGRHDEQLKFQLGYVDADGTSNFSQIGADSDLNAVLTATKTLYANHIHVSSDTTVPSGKRLWLKVIADATLGGSGYPEIGFYFDAVEHHLSFGIGGEVLDNFVLKSGSEMSGALTLPNSGLHVLDTGGDHDLIITPGTDLGADRILTLTTGDAARTITLSGNPTLSDWFDQGVKVADSPQFTGIELGHADDTTILRSGSGDATIEGKQLYRADGTDVADADVEDDLTIASTKVITGLVGTVTDVDGFTMSALQGRGYVVYATGAGTIVMPPAVAGANFSVEVHAAAAVVLDPDASGTEDTIRLDGVALTQGFSITSTSTAGDIAVCTYFAADVWSCITNGWTDTGS